MLTSCWVLGSHALSLGRPSSRVVGGDKELARLQVRPWSYPLHTAPCRSARLSCPGHSGDPAGSRGLTWRRLPERTPDCREGPGKGVRAMVTGWLELSQQGSGGSGPGPLCGFGSKQTETVPLAQVALGQPQQGQCSAKGPCMPSPSELGGGGSSVCQRPESTRGLWGCSGCSQGGPGGVRMKRVWHPLRLHSLGPEGGREGGLCPPIPVPRWVAGTLDWEGPQARVGGPWWPLGTQPGLCWGPEGKSRRDGEGTPPGQGRLRGGSGPTASPHCPSQPVPGCSWEPQQRPHLVPVRGATPCPRPLASSARLPAGHGPAPHPPGFQAPAWEGLSTVHKELGVQAPACHVVLEDFEGWLLS